MLADLFRRLFLKERRGASAPVAVDRRRPRMRAAESALQESIDRFEKTVRLRKSMLAQNDPQNIVEFSTFTEICTFKGPKLGEMTICRHPDCKRTVTACAQENCPFMNQKSRAA